MLPLQSLSTPSHTSVVGFTEPWQMNLLAEQINEPALQGGESLGETGTSHGFPTSGLLSVQQLAIVGNTH
jgi:hypothetical protein